MTAGAGNQPVARPVPFRGRARQATEYYFSFYVCACGAHPFTQNGIVTVEHRQWCPTGALKRLAKS